MAWNLLNNNLITFNNITFNISYQIFYPNSLAISMMFILIIYCIFSSSYLIYIFWQTLLLFFFTFFSFLADAAFFIWVVLLYHSCFPYVSLENVFIGNNDDDCFSVFVAFDNLIFDLNGMNLNFLSDLGIALRFLSSKV